MPEFLSDFLRATLVSSTDVDSVRAVLITSLAVAFVMYAKTRLVTGGTLTPAWFLLLILEERWAAIVGTVITTALVLALVRYVILPRRALSRSWQAAISVLLGVLLTAILVIAHPVLAGLELSGAWGFLIAVGLYVTPGLIAYDMLRQGVRKTAMSIAIVTLVSGLLSLPVVTALSRLVQGGSAVVIVGDGRIPESLWWLATLIAVSVTVIWKLGLGWRAGGFLAGLFAFEALNWQTAALAVLFAIATYLLVAQFDRFVVLTPRQRFQVSLLIGALLSWFGLYWFTQFNFVPAIMANGYPIAPLLIVGLLAADFSRDRRHIPQVVVGMVIVALAVWLGIWVAQASAWGHVVVVVVLLGTLLIWLLTENRRFYRAIQPALGLGGRYSSRVPVLRGIGNSTVRTDNGSR